MAKGNPGGNPATLPQLKYSDEEKRTIDVLSRYRESFSHEDIARTLNTVFVAYNRGCRTGKGVQKYIAKRREDLAAGAVPAA